MYVYRKSKLTNTCIKYGIVCSTNSFEMLKLYIILGDISINIMGYFIMSGESPHSSDSEELLVEVGYLSHALSISTFLLQTVNLLSPLIHSTTPGHHPSFQQLYLGHVFISKSILHSVH
jgi:hypothetical protein